MKLVAIATIAIVSVLLALAFYGGIAYVGYHFIVKYW